MNSFFSQSGNLALSVSDPHSHKEAIFNCCVLALLKFVLIREELIDHAHVLEFFCIFVEGLSTDYKDVVRVPWEINCDDVRAIRELFIRSKLNSVPLISLNGVAFDGIQTLGLTVGELIEHKAVIHSTKHENVLIV